MYMNITNQTGFPGNDSILASFESTNPCPRQRHITRPLLFVHNYSLFFFGSIFNFLAFAILMQRSLRCHSTFAYLAFLSLSNGLLSLVHFSKWMFKYYFNFLFESFLITCRFHRFSSDFLTHFSLFTLICVNIDRARTVTQNRPNTKYPKSKFHMVLMKEFLVASILCAFHFHWIIKYGYEVSVDGKKEAKCTYDDSESTSKYYYFLSKIYPPFELAVFVCLPLLINIFCTILIVRSLNIRMRTAKQFRPSKATITNPRDKTSPRKSSAILSYFLPKTATKSSIHSCFCFQLQCRRHTRIRLKVGRTKQSLIKYDEENDSNNQNKLTNKTSNILDKKHRTRRTRDIHLSAMLISLNVLYLLLNLPFNFHQTFEQHFYKQNSDRCMIMFTSLLFDTLQQTFFSTNFFLYVLTNRRFREEFCNTIINLLPHRTTEILARKNVNNNNNRNNNLHPYRPRSSSCNLSTTMCKANQNSANPMISIPVGQNRDSIISDMELTETLPIQQETILLMDENNKSILRLVLLKDLANDRRKIFLEENIV